MDNTNKATLFRMTTELRESATKTANSKGLTLSGWIRMLIVLEIEKENQKNNAKSIDKCISNDI
jgi:hypothetical protein